MKQRLSLVILCTSGALLLSRCSGPVQPGVVDVLPVEGVFSLALYGPDTLPVNLSQLPTRNGQESGCWLQVTEGALSFDVPSHTFEYHYLMRDSCNGDILATYAVQGTYTQQDSVLRCARACPTGLCSFAGTVKPDTVVVGLEPPPLTFVKD